MKSKRKFLIPALAVVLTAALAVGVFFFYKAFKKRINPEDQMIHNTQERIEYAQSCYKEFSKNPNKTYTVLVSLDSVTTEEVYAALHRLRRLHSGIRLYNRRC